MQQQYLHRHGQQKHKIATTLTYVNGKSFVWKTKHQPMKYHTVRD